MQCCNSEICLLNYANELITHLTRKANMILDCIVCTHKNQETTIFSFLFPLIKQATFTLSRGAIYFPSPGSSSRPSSLPFWSTNTARLTDTSPSPLARRRPRRPRNPPERARARGRSTSWTSTSCSTCRWTRTARTSVPCARTT